VTDREQAVIQLAIEWRETRFAVAKALIESDLIHAVDMLKKERRDELLNNPDAEASAGV